jgi:2-C-methyl-D-erythritol 2,4-cyclodiphosphate synthase
MTLLRTGIGYDVHALVEGRPLIVGGVTIPHTKGLDGHSDADVLAHAITDALLGAARIEKAMDIGQLFPDTDDAHKGADSLELLRKAAEYVHKSGFRVVDVDSVIIAQAPKMTPHREAMRAKLADTLGIEISQVGVKATTTEWLGFEGREEGIAAQASILLEGTG